MRLSVAREGFVLAFASGCALSSVYGFLAGTWPFGVVEAIWTVIGIQRYRTGRSASRFRQTVLDRMADGWGRLTGAKASRTDANGQV